MCGINKNLVFATGGYMYTCPSLSHSHSLVPVSHEHTCIMSSGGAESLLSFNKGPDIDDLPSDTAPDGGLPLLPLSVCSPGNGSC